MKTFKFLISLSLLPVTGQAVAAVSNAKWDAMQKQLVMLNNQIEAMNQRVEQVEAENRELRALSKGAVTVEDLEPLNSNVAILKQQNEASSWAENLKWQGDFRYRHEDIREDDKDDRDRNRIRARAALTANLPDNVQVGLGMASGGDDPVSTNQTLGGGGSTKDLRLDLAYATWKPLKGSFITVGKFKNPFHVPQKSQMIWDGDYRPEGLSLGWKGDTFFVAAEGSWLESDSDKDDEYLWGVQGGMKSDIGNTSVTATAKYLSFPVQGMEAFYDDNFYGNSTVIVGGVEVYEFDYSLLNATLEVDFELLDIPLNLFGDFVQNDDADDLDTGFTIGGRVGKAKAPGSWQLQYEWQDLEADATFGLVNDSDWAGGDTDGKGHTWSGKYMVNKKWSLGFTYFDVQRGVDQGNDADYKRLQVDTAYKY